MFCHSLGCQSLGHLRSTWIALSACVVFARLIAKHGVFLVGTLRKSEELCVHVSELVQGSQERKCLKASVIARNLEPAQGRKTNISISIVAAKYILVRITSTYIDLAHFGGHARHILSTLSPSQPVNADEEIVCWKTLPKFFAFFAFCDIHFFICFSPVVFVFSLFRFYSHTSTAVLFFSFRFFVFRYK